MTKYSPYIENLHSKEVDYTVEFLNEPTKAEIKVQEKPKSFIEQLKEAVLAQREPIPPRPKIIRESLFDFDYAFDFDLSGFENLDLDNIKFVPVLFNGKPINDLNELNEKN